MIFVVSDVAAGVAVLGVVEGEAPLVSAGILSLLAPTTLPTTTAMMITVATATRMVIIPLSVHQNGRFATGVDTLPPNSAGAKLSFEIFSGIAASAIVRTEGGRKE